jgi:hypothetical protein
MRFGICDWAILLMIAVAGPAQAQTDSLLQGAAAFSDWRADAPGVRRIMSDEGRVWGRPVSVTVAKDGTLLFSEDANGTIWKISHRRPRRPD